MCHCYMPVVPESECGGGLGELTHQPAASSAAAVELCRAGEQRRQVGGLKSCAGTMQAAAHDVYVPNAHSQCSRLLPTTRTLSNT